MSIASNSHLDPQLVTLLGSLRQRIKRYVVWDSVLAILAVALLAFWIGLALDYVPVLLGGTEMPKTARTILLLIVAALIVSIVAKMLIGRLSRPLPDDSLALLVERHHPKLGGRLVTAVQLNQPGRTGDSHSRELLRRVHGEAAAAVDEVDPNRIFRWEPLARKAMVVIPLLLMMIGFAIFSPQSFGHAMKRLTLISEDPWPRRAQLEMVGIELPVISASEEITVEPELKTFDESVLRLPSGSNATLRIRANADTAEVPTMCTVYYRTDSGTRGQSNMRRVGRVIDGYQSFVLEGPPLAGLSESFSFSVHGLDDRLEGYRVESVQPPAITEMQVNVRLPEYLRREGSGEFDLQTDYQAGLRISEGSDVTLVATSSTPLGDADVMLKSDAGESNAKATGYSDDRLALRLTLDDFRTATTVRVVPKDADGITSQAAYRYFMGVIIDEPPELDLRLRGVGTAVTPIARIPVESVVTDDYGVDQLRVSVAPSNESESTLSASTYPKVGREGDAETVLDLRDLVADGKLNELSPGGAINVFAEATDFYDLGDKHETRSEVFRLQVVTPEELLALLERRELAMRARLEQTIDETRGLRDTLDQLRRKGFDESDDSDDATPEKANDSQQDDADAKREQARKAQLRRLRVEQSLLQATKTSEELTGIATSLDDLLLEMINNRVDSVDRRERIGTGVRDPLKKIVEGSLADLVRQIKSVEQSVTKPDEASEKTRVAVEMAEDVLLQLTAVLDKMLDLESYNEILDIVRGLIDDQNELKEETEAEFKKSLKNLFQMDE